MLVMFSCQTIVSHFHYSYFYPCVLSQRHEERNTNQSDSTEQLVDGYPPGDDANTDTVSAASEVLPGETMMMVSLYMHPPIRVIYIIIFSYFDYAVLECYTSSIMYNMIVFFSLFFKTKYQETNSTRIRHFQTAPPNDMVSHQSHTYTKNELTHHVPTHLLIFVLILCPFIETNHRTKMALLVL